MILPIQKEVQKQIHLANTHLTAYSRDCKRRESCDKAIEKREDAIKKIGTKAKKQTMRQLKNLNYFKKENELIRFAVGKRFTVWRAQLEGVRKSSKSWNSRNGLWNLLVEANKHQYDAFYLHASMSM